MKRAFFIILFVFTVVICFGADKFIGISLGKAEFDDMFMDLVFKEPISLELRVQKFDRVNHLKGFTLSAWATTESGSGYNSTRDYSQIGASAQFTPTLYVPISEVASLYLFAGAGLGVVSSTFSIEYDDEEDEDDEDYYGNSDDTFISFNYTVGAKLILNDKLCLDLYFQSVSGDHEDIDVGYGTVYFGASKMF